MVWLLPCLIVAILYAQTRRHGFIDFDDSLYTFENPMVARGLSGEGVKWAFSGSHVANYHPLTWLSHMLDVELWGMDPGAFSLVNASLHAANALLVSLVFARIFGSSFLGIVVGIVFAAHPKLVEAVAWISQRKTLLSTFFALGVMLLYLRADRDGGDKLRSGPYFGALTLYVLSLLAKGMYVTMPAILLVLEMVAFEHRCAAAANVQGEWTARYRINAENLRRMAGRLWPFALLSVFVSGVTYWAQGEAVQSFSQLPLADRCVTALTGFATYLRHFFHPAELSVYYPRNEMWDLATVFAAGGLLIGISVALYALHRHTSRSAFLGWSLFLGMLLPVIGIIQVGDQASADRYMYGPILGLLVLTVCLHNALRRYMTKSQVRLAMYAGLAMWVSLTAIATYRQVHNWRNSLALAVASEGNVGPHPQLLSVQVAILARNGDYASALPLCQQALAMAPDHLALLNNLAVVEFGLGNTDAAVAICRRYIELAPEKPAGFINLALYCARSSRFAEAREALDSARAKSPLTVSQQLLLAEIESRIRDGSGRPL